MSETVDRWDEVTKEDPRITAYRGIIMALRHDGCNEDVLKCFEDDLKELINGIK